MPPVYTAIEDASVHLLCKISSQPNLFTVRWFKNEQELIINSTLITNPSSTALLLPDYQIETNGTVSVLRIFEVKANNHKSSFRCAVNSTVYPSSSPNAVTLKSQAITQLNVLCKLNKFK